MSQEKPSLAEILHKNRSFVLAMLGVPVLGIVIAAGLIIYLRPDNMVVALGVILFVGMQYILFMFFWMKRVEKLANKSTEEKEMIQIHSSTVEPFNIDNQDEILSPEEKRVLPVEDE